MDLKLTIDISFESSYNRTDMMNMQNKIRLKAKGKNYINTVIVRQLKVVCKIITLFRSCPTKYKNINHDR